MLRQVFAVGDDEAGHICFSHLKGEIVGVEFFAFQGEEDGIFLDFAAIGGNFVGLLEVLVYRFNGIHGVCFNEKSRLNGSNGFNRIMKRLLLGERTAHLVHGATETDGGCRLVLVEVAARARAQVVRTVSP